MLLLLPLILQLLLLLLLVLHTMLILLLVLLPYAPAAVHAHAPLALCSCCCPCPCSCCCSCCCSYSCPYSCAPANHLAGLPAVEDRFLLGHVAGGVDVAANPATAARRSGQRYGGAGGNCRGEGRRGGGGRGDVQYTQGTSLWQNGSTSARNKQRQCVCAGNLQVKWSKYHPLRYFGSAVQVGVAGRSQKCFQSGICSSTTTIGGGKAVKGVEGGERQGSPASEFPRAGVSRRGGTAAVGP